VSFLTPTDAAAAATIPANMKFLVAVAVLISSVSQVALAFSALNPSYIKPLPPGNGGNNPNEKPTWNINSANNAMFRVEGQTRRTWDFDDVRLDTVQTIMTSSGRPIQAEIELWIGPDWTPCTLKVYSEDGDLRPVQTLIGTRNKSARIECRNVNAMEFPFNAACVYAKPELAALRSDIPESVPARYVEGGAIYTVPFDSSVKQVQVYLQTDARQLKAKVELLNGTCSVQYPKNNDNAIESRTPIGTKRDTHSTCCPLILVSTRPQQCQANGLDVYQQWTVE
jgi:hypothetical protein